MREKRFYVNGEFWKKLEVSEAEMNQTVRKYAVATKPSGVRHSEECTLLGRTCKAKQIHFVLSSLGTFAIEDDELFVEDGCLYLKE